MSLDPNEKKSQSVRRGLIYLLVSLQLVTVSLIFSITHFSTNRDIDQQIEQLLQSGLNESKEHTQGFLENAYRSVQLSQRLLEANVLSDSADPFLERYFLSQLQTHAEMTGIYFASWQGDFYFVNRDKRGDKAGFLTKKINAEAPGVATFQWRDSDLNILETKSNQPDDYRPLERLWYQQAVKKQSLIWTEPYIFYTSQQPGITVSSPIFGESGELVGVVGVDIELTSLSKFLANLKVFGAVSVFMVSETGNFVAAPAMITDEERLTLKNLNITDSKGGALALEKEAMDLFIRLSKTNSEQSIFSQINYKDSTYRLRYEVFQLQDGPGWIIGAYAMEDDFLEEIRNGENRNMLIASIILAISLVIGWLLIRRTWQPLERFFHDVITDQLTGLFNRRFLENIGSRMYIRLLRNQHKAISIAVIDLDSFKQINQEFGSSTGNRVLMEFADFLKRTLRPEDIITRYSGDVFVVIFPGMEHDCAVSIVDRMRRELGAWPLTVGDLLIRVTFSVGVETIDDKTRIADAAFTDFIEVAKKAMCNAKNKGRDTVISANLSNIQLDPEQQKVEA